MADDYGHVGKTLDEIKRQIATKVDEATRLLVTANTLEAMIGVQPSSLVDFIGSGEMQDQPQTGLPPIRSVGAPSFSRTASPRSIKPDQFLGQQPLDAAKAYLGMVGHAVHFDEIADAIQRGGAATKGADWRDKLEMSLLKSVYEVVKVQDKTYGLVNFYSAEQIANLRGTRRREAPKKAGKGAKKSARNKTAKAPKSTANAAPERPKKPAKQAPVETPAVDATVSPPAQEQVPDQVH